MSDHPLPLAPSSILIVGAGVFGLSTALALLSAPRYRETRITILDSRTPTPTSGPEQKTPPTASIDSSRIVRADYAVPAYAALAATAQTLWRQSWGGPTAYHESGLCFTSYRNGGSGEGYVEASLENVRALNKATGGSDHTIEILKDAAEIKRVMKGAGGGSGDWGYVNWRSGWVDAEGAVVSARRKIHDLAKTHPGGVEWIHGSASRLLFSTSPPPSTERTITGVQLSTHGPLRADLTILATGAYTPLLLPLSLSSRVIATGQAVAYLQLSAAETARLADIPVLLNESTGMFLIPPTAAGVLKIARHGFGWRNPVRATAADCERPRSSREDGEGGAHSAEAVTISIPADDYTALPREATHALRAALADMVPWLADRPFSGTRLCWYADTPTGDFLIDFHPSFGRSLLLATGGSGHGFKFLPVLGRKVVARVEGRLGGRGGNSGWGGETGRVGDPGENGKVKDLDADLGRLWAWGEGRAGEWECEDGSRGGGRGMRYAEEMARGKEEGAGRESKL